MKPIAALAQLAAQLSSMAMNFEPPKLVLEGVQDRLLLLLNHILMQEPAATSRLQRQQNRTVFFAWRDIELACRITPAGLFERTVLQSVPDLSLQVSQTSALSLLKTLSQGEKPTMQVQGDVMLAADINWLVDHVRWDIEEDLSRLMGDALAHQCVAVGKKIFKSVRPS
jgi:ubiquinone biosynthesis accessory factor UbiJ